LVGICARWVQNIPRYIPAGRSITHLPGAVSCLAGPKQLLKNKRIVDPGMRTVIDSAYTISMVIQCACSGESNYVTLDLHSLYEPTNQTSRLSTDERQLHPPVHSRVHSASPYHTNLSLRQDSSILTLHAACANANHRIALFAGIA
jgi:hypothetical protein